MTEELKKTFESFEKNAELLTQQKRTENDIKRFVTALLVCIGIFIVLGMTFPDLKSMIGNKMLAIIIVVISVVFTFLIKDGTK